MTDAVIIHDTNGATRYANSAAIVVFGFDPTRLEFNELMQKLAIRHLNGRPVTMDEHPVTRAFNGEIIAEELFILTNSDGKDHYLLATASPLYSDTRKLGVISVWHDCSVAVLERELPEKEMSKNTSRIEIIAALSRSFAEAGLEYQTVLNTIVSKVSEVSGGACIIRLLTDDGLWIDQIAFQQPDAEATVTEPDLSAATRQPSNTGLSGQVIQSGKLLCFSNYAKSGLGDITKVEYWPWKERKPVKSLAIAPMRVRGQLIGTLGVYRFTAENPYIGVDNEFIQEIADRAAYAIDNARLYLIETQRVQELDTLHNATTALLTTLDLETLLSHILNAAISAIPVAEKGALYLITADTGELQMRAVSGYSDPRIKKVLLKSEGYPVEAVKRQKPLLIHDLQNDPHNLYASDIPELQTVRSAIVAPLIYENQILGVLALDSSEQAAFTEKDLRLLVSFAKTTTTAIQNATLHREVQKQAITDAITGLYNRRGFFELGRREVERTRRTAYPLSAIMIDIDHFKRVNDTHTHAVGDQVLQALAKRLRSNLREMDVLGRYGGEEFCILLPETDLFTACNVAERLRHCVEETLFLTERGPLAITISLGVSRLEKDTNDLETLLNQADIAMYAAKQAGRNRVEVR